MTGINVSLYLNAELAARLDLLVKDRRREDPKATRSNTLLWLLEQVCPAAASEVPALPILPEALPPLPKIRRAEF